MKNIFGFLTVVIFSVAVSSFAQAEDSASGAVSGSGTVRSIENQAIRNGLDRILGSATTRPIVLESTSVVKDTQGKRSVFSASKEPVHLELSLREGTGAIKNIYMTPAGSLIVRSTEALTFYNSDGIKLKKIDGAAIYSSDNNKYFAVAKCVLSSEIVRGQKPWLCSVRLHDDSGNLLWERKTEDILSVQVSSKGHVAVFPLIEKSGSVSIFDVNGVSVTPVGVFKDGNAYDLTFSDSGDVYFLRKTYKERQTIGKNKYMWYTSLHLFRADGIELCATKMPGENNLSIIRVKPVIGAEAFVFSKSHAGESVSEYTYSDVGNKEFRKMDGLNGYVLKYVKYLGSNRLAIFTMDSFAIWDLSRNIALSEYLVNGDSDNRPHGHTAFAFENVMYVGNRFIVFAMGPHRHDYTEGGSFIFVFDSTGQKVMEKSFPIGKFMSLEKVSLVGNELLFDFERGYFHSLRIE